MLNLFFQKFDGYSEENYEINNSNITTTEHNDNYYNNEDYIQITIQLGN